jgi:uncharacterized protein (DUF736 family)
MTTIATFTPAKDGSLQGTIKTLTLNAKVKAVRIESANEKAPALRFFAGPVELGAGWLKTAETSGRPYHQCRLDDPSFPAPMLCNLIRNDDTGTFDLIWSRPKGRKAGGRPRKQAN